MKKFDFPSMDFIVNIEYPEEYVFALVVYIAAGESVLFEVSALEFSDFLDNLRDHYRVITVHKENCDECGCLVYRYNCHLPGYKNETPYTFGQVWAKTDQKLK